MAVRNYQAGPSINFKFESFMRWLDGQFIETWTLLITGFGPMYASASDFIPDTQYNIMPLGNVYQDIVRIPDGITTIAANCFAGLGEGIGRDHNIRGVQSVIIGRDVESIGAWAFYSEYTSRYPKLLYVTVNGDKLTSIGPYAFQNQNNIAYLDFKTKVTSVGNGAFSGCTDLQYINISDDWVWVADGPHPITFENCHSLRVISPRNVIHELSGYNYYKCNSLNDIVIDPSELHVGSPGALYVDLYAGSDLDEDGYFITEVNTNNEDIINYDWKGNFNRILVLKADNYLYLYHLGRIIKIGVFDEGDNPGDVGIKYSDVILFLRLTSVHSNSQTPLFIAHDGHWWQVKYY
jgi:hypothetical protein